ncbi:MAG TPA: hypothetical protein VEJ42_02095 [Streptosporangiaceae bacterium]|nr:hypothetical protein [Streptosporangiaceae bacterium]
MLRTARLTDALRGRGKTLAVSLGAAAALAGAGSASAALTASAVSATHEPAAVHAALATADRVSASPLHVTPTVSTAHAATVADHAAPTQPAPASAQHSTAAPLAAPAQQPAPAAVQPAPAPQPASPQTQQPVTQPASGPYQIYDSVTPSSIPPGQQAAVYADGTYAASPSQVAGHANTLWIDTNGSDPSANALDVEPGDATPAQAGTWVAQKLSETPNQVAIIYTMQADWPAVQATIGQLPTWMQSHVRWWIADPTGVPHMVPGASATQWYWGPNYDISTANPGF